jgi:hypothetical protein
MVSVKVYWRDTGKPAGNQRVKLSIDGLFSGGITGTEITRSDGSAHFDVESGQGKVFVDGKEVHRGRLAGCITVYR